MNALRVAQDLIIRQRETGEDLTRLKLQKLLYYVRGWSLAIEGAPRFPECVEARKCGPAVRDQGEHEYGKRPLLAPAASFDDDPLLDAVLEVYAPLTAGQLIALSRQERPWRDTYKPSHRWQVISDDLILVYFAQEAVQEFSIHGEFLDAYRARRHGVVEWKPAIALSWEDVLAMKEAFAN